jgi:hypothetical protein
MAKERTGKIAEDQKWFRHHSMRLERIGEALFGKKYYKAIDRSDMQFWHNLYVEVFEVLRSSALRSMGSVDPDHRKNITEAIEYALDMLRTSKTKDETNAAVIAALFDLVFLLLGRSPYSAGGKVRDLSTFRTLTYSQTEEQLSYQLQSYIHRRPHEHGFSDPFEADYAYLVWTRERKKSRKDRSAYCEWMRERFPKTYALFR